MQATAKFTKKETKTSRFLLASAIGGVYSFVILFDLPTVVVALSKALAAGVIVAAAFRFLRVKSFLAAYAVFFFTNYVFLGIVYGLTLAFKTPYIMLDNGTVYVNIGARGLLASAFFAYIVSCLAVRIYNRRLAAGQIYTLTVENGGNTAKLYAFSDTGNKLREPFSDAPVIIADKRKVESLVAPDKVRIIPASTVNSNSFMLSFRPERVTVHTANGAEELQNVYIALSDDMHSDTFSAIINPEILSV